MTAVAQRSELAFTDPGHGEAFTDHMVSIDYTPETGWSRPSLQRLADIAFHPATIGLHYGQVAFEGLKAHRLAEDGSMVVFRPRDNGARFQRSAARMAMPELPEELFLEAVDQLIRVDSCRLSDNPLHSIYLRPLLFGTDISLMLRPSRNYRFLLMAFVAGGFFGKDVDAVSVFVNHDYARAFPGGTGDVKIAGNYGPTFIAQQQADAMGCPQVIWLDALERRYVEEMSGMSLFLVRGTGPGATIVTPTLSGTLLPGVTRDTMLRIAERCGFKASEERIELEQWRKECQDGTITEAFACGTAAVVTPVGQVRDRGGDFLIGDGTPGPVTLQLRTALTDLHHGVMPDLDGWLHHCS
jgi:branched-chain amino acid aminotransferase